MPKKKKEEEPVVQALTEEAAKDFVGFVPDLDKVKVYPIIQDKYRIDVWCRRSNPDRLVDDFWIDKSFFVSFVDGVVVDKTL
jgi:hypothetical protein